MNNMSKIAAALLLGLATQSALAVPAAVAKNIDGACANDIRTAGCEGKTMGKGLMRCLKTYKKSHKEFALAPACQEAIDKARAQRKARK